ncbi:uncharacterized protein LOC119573505 [Penaeus monodon]|uniref:uncharacterized protein LOC119573505 n=1 Tax=Penaeus monodon TaxID=6687 RepID=UPI0018A784B4|nr:uncharacterized protein LOC119573505 [Penaeus monodon]
MFWMTFLNAVMKLLTNNFNAYRKIIQGLQAQYKRDVSRLEDKLKFGKFPSTQQSLPESDGGPGNNRNQKEYIKQEPHFEKWQPIGQIKSWFRHKKGTPRQVCVTTLSRGMLKIDKGRVFKNPHIHWKA